MQEPEGVRENMLDLNSIPIEDWSSQFSIVDLVDFQVSFQSYSGIRSSGAQSLNMMQKVTSKNRYKTRWCDPNELNHFRRFIKVSVTAEDEATIFVVLTRPNMPEYSINNYTFQQVHFRQKGLKNDYIDRFCKPATNIELNFRSKLIITNQKYRKQKCEKKKHTRRAPRHR